MTTNADSAGPLDRNVRAQFEAWIKAPPFERRCMRWPTDDTSAWPGSYRNYEVELAWCAWKAAVDYCVSIVEKYRVPVGNSSAGELACEWTMEALREIRDTMRT
jgi:hypothetical protein